MKDTISGHSFLLEIAFSLESAILTCLVSSLLSLLAFAHAATLPLVYPKTISSSQDTFSTYICSAHPFQFKINLPKTPLIYKT